MTRTSDSSAEARPPDANDDGSTRQRLIRAAWDLFTERGYEETPVQAIIDAVGVSKGAFYHHFNGKDDLLDAVFERMMTVAMDTLEPILAAPADPVTRLNRFLREARQWRIRHLAAVREIVLVFLSEQNLRLRYRLRERQREVMVPVLGRIIAEGVKAGQMDSAFPEDSALLLMSINELLAEQLIGWYHTLPTTESSLDMIMDRLEFYFTLLERLLGMQPGGLDRVQRQEVWTFFTRFHG